jgi:hypothetical protein
MIYALQIFNDDWELPFRAGGARETAGHEVVFLLITWIEMGGNRWAIERSYFLLY